MTVPELAARIGVDQSTAFRYLRAGKLPGVQVGSRWLIDRERVERFMAGHEDAAGGPLVAALPVTTTLTLLPEPAQDLEGLRPVEAALALRWLRGAHAALGLLVAGAGEGNAEERGGQRVAG